nr:MAG TPA: hypothetical protein [Crassvirales sp.]
MVGSLDCESRLNASIAEWLKLLPLKEKILSSILSGGTIFPYSRQVWALIF